MAASSLQAGAKYRLDAQDFQHLLDALAARGYDLIGPLIFQRDRR